ncbi:vWA domain-containing protein [Chryseobacterium sp. R2A-55]|uniref:vWA domain-containing protein n=1 Tax=Chryseobacterium sp. R2A-55 TaxID=2744445 RepID=UPI001F1E07E2|nr:vWA domain-containing protein [Chryseobacterium sp. R2A-55]
MYNLDTLQISSTHPCLIIYLLDQSASMAGNFGYDTSKAVKLAESVNEIIFETGLKCYSSGGELKNRFELSIIGYGAEAGLVEPGWEGNLRDHWVVSIGEVFQNAIGEQNDVPIWIRPKAGMDTPMTKAFENAHRICEAWINWGNHKDCHPPIIINISDGVPTDSENNDSKLVNTVNNLKKLGTNYGNVNIFNIHISSGGGDSILFPTHLANSNIHANLLFEISTNLTDKMVAIAKNKNYHTQIGSKGYIYNGTARNLMDFLQISSDPV